MNYHHAYRSDSLGFGRADVVLREDIWQTDPDTSEYIERFADDRRRHGLEMHSIEFGNPAGVVEGWEGRSTQPTALLLTADSPAIDSGDPASPVPAGGGKRADIGPFERGAANDAPGLRARPHPPAPADLRIVP